MWIFQMDTAVDKALHVLGALEHVGSAQTVSDIASDLGLPRSTVHRLLGILVRNSFAQQHEDGRYALGLRAFALGRFATAHNSLLALGRQILDELVEDSGETVHLGVLQGRALLYVDRREPQDVAVRLSALPSPLTSLHASASGKTQLAHADEAFVDAVLAEPLERYTPRTVTDPVALREELARIRSEGFAMNEQERFPGVRAVAVALLRPTTGEGVASFSIAGPVQRMTATKVHALRSLLFDAAAEFERSFFA